MKVDGKRYGNDVQSMPYNVLVGYGTWFKFSKKSYIIVTWERFLFSFFEKPFSKFYDKPFPISGNTIYGLKVNYQYVF